MRMMSILSLLIISISILAFAYYTNTNKYFEDSRQDDTNGGLALERFSNEFIDDGCGSGTILDTVTGLCWLKNMSTFGQQNWTNALINCSNLNYAGHINWEVPTRNELFTLINQIGVSGSTCTMLSGFGFTNCQNNFYWSNTIYQLFISNAWIVNFGSGDDNLGGKSNSYIVTCVVRN